MDGKDHKTEEHCQMIYSLNEDESIRAVFVAVEDLGVGSPGLDMIRVKLSDNAASH